MLNCKLRDRSTAGTVIFKLNEKEYVKKNLASDDRRSYVVRLTPKAKDIIENIEKKAEDLSALVLIGSGEDEINVLFRSLKKIISNLSEGE